MNKPDIIARAARTLRTLLAEHRDEFDTRMVREIAIVTTGSADADRLKQGVADAVAEHVRRHRADTH